MGGVGTGKRLATLLMHVVVLLAVMMAPGASARLPGTAGHRASPVMAMSCGAVGHGPVVMAHHAGRADGEHDRGGDDCCMQSACSATLPAGPLAVRVAERRATGVTYSGHPRVLLADFAAAPDLPPPRQMA
ncbi:hypothetical protein [Acetobacter fallax]|nr:hypothetical protein [Acetobacter fallax]